MQAHVEVRAMVEDDLPAVSLVANAAFGALFERMLGQAVPQPFFPPLLAPTRYRADPDGCLVAVDEAGTVVGALMSVRRGSLAWFGPLAVAPQAQGEGIGQALTAACVERWRAHGTRLMGLETFGQSDQHVHLYSKLGFRPAWTATSLKRSLDPAMASDGAEVEINAAPPNLDYLYPGLDLSAEATGASAGLGATLATGDGGFAILHVEPTFTRAGEGFLPFVAAPDGASFTRLISAAEQICAERGLSSLVVNVPGANWHALESLRTRGYRMGWTMIRMKQGEHLDYDRADVYYCDNWK